MGRQRVGIALLGLTVSLSVPLPGAGQRLLEACPNCAIRMTPLAVIGDTDGLGALGRPGIALRRRTGDWIVTDHQDAGRLRLYSEGGAFSRILSRAGQGPAEFLFVFDMAEANGDSVYFIDQDNARLAVRDEHLRPARTTRLTVPARDAVILSDGSLVVATGPWQWQEGTKPLAYLSSQGEVLAAFGEVPPGTELGDSDRWWRTLVAPTDSTVLAVGLTEYVLREWSLDGRLIQRLERDVAWFRPHDDFGPRRDHSEAPGPGVVAMEKDADGLIWVMITVPDPSWEEGVGPGRDPYGRAARVVTDPDRYYDTVIEVIDPTSWSVLASHRVDPLLNDFAAPGVVYGRATTELGIPVIRSWMVELVR